MKVIFIELELDRDSSRESELRFAANLNYLNHIYLEAVHFGQGRVRIICNESCIQSVARDIAQAQVGAVLSTSFYEQEFELAVRSHAQDYCLDPIRLGRLADSLGVASLARVDSEASLEVALSAAGL